MSRQPRKPSETGIFHVMMRGINHQEIFCEAEDYYQFINTLDRMRTQYVIVSEYFTTLLRYIHQNPVKAGIVTEVKDY
jgi:REP element-mobilizing transposase RayT